MRLPSLPWYTAPVLVLLGFAAGGILNLAHYEVIGDVVWGITLVAGSLPMFWEMLMALRRGHFGIDIIAIVAIASSIALHQYLAGIVILLMLSGGEALEIFALRRARKDLTSLINNAPMLAHKQVDGALIDVAVDAALPGDTIVIKPGESVPVDGQILKGRAMVDESKLTGEPIPVEKREGSNIMSGSICQDGVLTVRVLRASHESKYEQILRLVRDAEEKKAPFVRLADRYSVWFTSATFILAGVAWFLSNDPIRVLAVLVVATPCPLILATPIAFAAGISRAAKRGIIVKNGGALEKLGTARCFVFDKTGTLTLGVPKR
jgi:P-type E1-E2 ATPase